MSNKSVEDGTFVIFGDELQRSRIEHGNSVVTDVGDEQVFPVGRQLEVVRIVENRDDSTPVGRLYLALNDRIAAMEEPVASDADLSDPEQAAIWKTVQILLNKVIYADSYLQQGSD